MTHRGAVWIGLLVQVGLLAMLALGIGPEPPASLRTPILAVLAASAGLLLISALASLGPRSARALRLVSLGVVVIAVALVGGQAAVRWISQAQRDLPSQVGVAITAADFCTRFAALPDDLRRDPNVAAVEVDRSAPTPVIEIRAIGPALARRALETGELFELVTGALGGLGRVERTGSDAMRFVPDRCVRRSDAVEILRGLRLGSDTSDAPEVPLAEIAELRLAEEPAAPGEPDRDPSETRVWLRVQSPGDEAAVRETLRAYLAPRLSAGVSYRFLDAR